MADSPSEEVYEVEKIVDHKIVKKGKKSEIHYMIKWLNYSDNDNTWERESNVFAVDLIIKYWDALPPNDPGRRLFEQLQSRKKDPLILPSSVKPKVVSASSSPSPPSSKSHTISSKPQTISDMFKKQSAKVTSKPVVVASSSKAIEKPEDKMVQQTLNVTVSTPVQDTNDKGKGREFPISNDIQTKKLPQVIANNTDDEDDEDEEYDMNRVGENKDDLESHHSISSSQSDQLMGSDREDVEMEETHTKTDNHIRQNKPEQTDYFLQQHAKKRKREELGIEDSSSDADSIHSDTSSQKSLGINDDTVIFDENYGINPPLDWSNTAEEVEYIGKELPRSNLYCTIRWKDGARSIHPISLVRTKIPELLIDRFIKMTK